MNKRNTEIFKWQKRLENTFITNTIIGERLINIIDKENEYGSLVIKEFVGYRTLIDCFFDFYIETLNIVDCSIRNKGIPKDFLNYSSILLYTVTNFRSLRAAENLLLHGYPLDGYALLRDLKDRAIFLAAIINKITSFRLINGFDALSNTDRQYTQENYSKIKNRRKREERRVLDCMLRSKSGLDIELIEELKLWENLFHEEVHGSRLTFCIEGEFWLTGKKYLSIFPEINEIAVALYINRACEIDWMFLRTLPYLQFESKSFGNEWCNKWKVLNESFYFMLDSLLKENKKIASAIISLIDNKFSFSTATHYIEQK